MFNSLFIEKNNISLNDIHQNNFDKLTTVSNTTLIFPICKLDHWFLLTIQTYDENDETTVRFLDSKMEINDKEMKRKYTHKLMLSIRPFIIKILDCLSYPKTKIQTKWTFLSLQSDDDYSNCGVFMLLIIQAFYFSKLSNNFKLKDLYDILGLPLIEEHTNDEHYLVSLKNLIIQNLRICILVNNNNNNNNVISDNDNNNTTSDKDNNNNDDNNNNNIQQTKEEIISNVVPNIKIADNLNLDDNLNGKNGNTVDHNIEDDDNNNKETVALNQQIQIIDQSTNPNEKLKVQLETKILQLEENHLLQEDFQFQGDFNNNNNKQQLNEEDSFLSNNQHITMADIVNTNNNPTITMLQTRFNNVISNLNSRDFSNMTTSNDLIRFFDKFENNINILLNNEQLTYVLGPKSLNMIKYDNIGSDFMYIFKVYRDIISSNNFYDIEVRKNYAEKYLENCKYEKDTVNIIKNIKKYFHKEETNNNTYRNPTAIIFQPTTMDTIIISYMFDNFYVDHTIYEMILICLFVFGKQSKSFIQEFVNYYSHYCNGVASNISSVGTWLAGLIGDKWKLVTMLYEPSINGNAKHHYTLNCAGFERFEEKSYRMDNLKKLTIIHQPIMDSITNGLLLNEIEKKLEMNICDLLYNCYKNNNHHACSIEKIYNLISKNDSTITLIIFNGYIEKQRSYINSLFLFYGQLICFKLFKNNDTSLLNSNLEVDFKKYIENLDFKPFLRKCISIKPNQIDHNNEFENYFNCIEPIIINNITSTNIYHKFENDQMYILHKCDIKHNYDCCFKIKSSLLNNNELGINVGLGLQCNVQIMANTLLKVTGTGTIKKHTPTSFKQDNSYLFSFPTRFGNIMELDAKKNNENVKYHQSMAAYVNHSKVSNVKSVVITHILYQHDMFLLFKETVPKGGEIYFNYGLAYWKDNNNEDITTINNGNVNLNNNKRKAFIDLEKDNKKQKLLTMK